MLAYIYQVDEQSLGEVMIYDLISKRSESLSIARERSHTLSWSPGGRYLLLISGTAAVSQHTVVEAATGTDLHETRSLGYAWSPDGHRLALGLIQPLETPISVEPGDALSLGILDLETGEQQIVFEGTAERLYFPHVWLPDGRLLFERLDWNEAAKTGDYSRWTVRYVDGRVDDPQPAQEIPIIFDREAILARLPEDFRTASTHSFSWSPDEQWMVFRSSGGIYLFNWVTGGEPSLLVEGAAPAWQP